MAIARSKNGKSWRARVKTRVLVDGVMQDKWETATFDKYADAEKWESEVKSKASKGVLLDDTKSRTTTIAEYIADYLKRRTFNPETVEAPADLLRRTDVGVLKRVAKEPFAGLPLNAIHVEDIQKYVNRRLNAYNTEVAKAEIEGRDPDFSEAVKPNTVQREMKVLAALFNSVPKQRGYHLAVNPCKGLVYPEYNDARNRVMSDLEGDWILKAIEAQSRHVKEFKALFLLLYKSAPRVGSCLKMRWGQVDLDGRVIHMPAAITKNGKAWDVVMPFKVRDAIAAIKPEECSKNDFVFKRIWKDSSAVNTRWMNTLRKAKKLYVADCVEKGEKPDVDFLDDLHVHDLRHTSVTNMYHQYRNLSMFEIMNLAGHLDVASLQRYANMRTNQTVVDMIE